MPEVSLGLIPSAGGCTRLKSIIGATRTNSVILGGEKITAKQAVDWGIANKIAEKPYEESKQWAEQIASYDALALRLAKRVLQEPTLERERLCEAILYNRQKSNNH